MIFKTQWQSNLYLYQTVYNCILQTSANIKCYFALVISKLNCKQWLLVAKESFFTIFWLIDGKQNLITNTYLYVFINLKQNIMAIPFLS